MNRKLPAFVPTLLALGFMSLALLCAAGCLQPQTRGQADDDKDDILLEVTTIGDITDVGNFAPIILQGIGLVTNLAGTGSAPPSGRLREELEKNLRQKNVHGIKQLLDSPDTAMVIVSGMIPAGARKGDLIDVAVSLPPQSNVTSLRGGHLQECYLRVYDTAKNVAPHYKGRNRLLQGHVLGKASGPLLVGLDGNGEQGPNLRKGQIWDGGVSFVDRPYHFVLKKERKFMRFVAAVTQRLNTMYQDDVRKEKLMESYKQLIALGQVSKRLNQNFKRMLLDQSDIAKPDKNHFVYVNVPWEYRLNNQRYLRVARFVPLVETSKTRAPYRQRLKAMLYDPADAVWAALRLEALGKESIPSLRKGLKNQNPLVRFSCAESLAYLGSTSGVDELAKLADRHPELRAFCMTALASLDEPVSEDQLIQMLASVNAETRYGAFRALQLLKNRHPHIKGKLANNVFWIHRVAPDSEPLVHFSLHRRAEVVLFGRDAHLVPPFRIRAGKEFTVVAAPEDKRCTVSRYHLKLGRVLPKQCSMKLEDILHTLASLDAEYADVVDLMRGLQDHRCLSCGIALNAVPQPMDVEELARKGRDRNFLRLQEKRQALSTRLLENASKSRQELTVRRNH